MDQQHKEALRASLKAWVNSVMAAQLARQSQWEDVATLAESTADTQLDSVVDIIAGDL